MKPLTLRDIEAKSATVCTKCGMPQVRMHATNNLLTHCVCSFQVKHEKRGKNSKLKDPLEKDSDWKY